MNTFRFSEKSCESLPGLSVMERAFPGRFSADGVLLEFEAGRAQAGWDIQGPGGEAGFRVRYAAPCDAYRALGLLMAGDAPTGQDRACSLVGVMWDVSRNAVIRPEKWEEIFLRLALMGINSLQLYMEDVYEIPGEPFFGYGRGAYSAEELRGIDDAGRRLGIEVVPCIQTLGHLTQIEQWPPYHEMMDVPGVLMVDSERTRTLIGKMLDQVAACFRSRTIHIGMDEAHGIGTGNFLRKHGYERPFDILNRHLKMVTEMCLERGLAPMMWSDMYFRIGSARNDYYDREAVIPDEVAASVPPGVDLVYWDYYHGDVAFYEEWIQRHRALGKEPVFAPGGWNWGRFWAYEPKWRETLSAGMQAAHNQKLDRVFLTLWGDDGAEFHPASVFPAIQYFAEYAYVGNPDASALERQFAAIFPEVSLAGYLKASRLDEIPDAQGKPGCCPNPSKWILWHDPVLGFLNPQIPSDVSEHYRELAAALDHPGADEPLRFAAQVARAVALKAELHNTARSAWKVKNSAEMERLRDEIVPECVRALRGLRQAHQAAWMQWNKPFGWEVLERRYAGVIARVESLGALLDACLQNPAHHVSEWERDPLPIFERPEDAYFTFAQAATPSAIK